MKRLLIIAFLFVLPATGYGQFAVIDNLNAAIARSQLVKTLQQLEKFTVQIRAIKQQLHYTRRSYQRQIESLKRLDDANWSTISAINDNIRRVQNAGRNMVFLQNYIEVKYRDLYNTSKRLEKIMNDPEKAEKYEKMRKEHLKDAANDVITASEANIASSDEAYEYLQEVENEMNSDSLSPQQMRQIQAQIQSMSAQQLIEIKRIIAEHASFSAKLYRMRQEQKKDDKAKIKAFNAQFNQSFKQWKERIPKYDRKFVPDWAKDENSQ